MNWTLERFRNHLDALKCDAVIGFNPETQEFVKELNEVLNLVERSLGVSQDSHAIANRMSNMLQLLEFAEFALSEVRASNSPLDDRDVQLRYLETLVLLMDVESMCNSLLDSAMSVQAKQE